MWGSNEASVARNAAVVCLATLLAVLWRRLATAAVAACGRRAGVGVVGALRKESAPRARTHGLPPARLLGRSSGDEGVRRRQNFWRKWGGSRSRSFGRTSASTRPREGHGDVRPRAPTKEAPSGEPEDYRELREAERMNTLTRRTHST